MRYAVVFCLLTCAVAFADRVHLTDGRVLEGEATWINGGRQLELRVKLGALTFEKAEVVRVEEAESPAEAFARRLKALAPEQLAERVELGVFAREHKLEAEAAGVWIQVATYRLSEEQLAAGAQLDTTSIAAAKRHLEELDYHLHEGRWLPPEEYYPAIGYVRHKGMWVPKEVAELRERREAEEREAREARAEDRKAKRERRKALREASEAVAKQSKRLARLKQQIAQGQQEYAQLEVALRDLARRLETTRDRETVARLALDQWRVSPANDGSQRALQIQQTLVLDLAQAEGETRRLLTQLRQAEARAAELGAQLQQAPQVLQAEEAKLKAAEAALAALEGGSTPPSSSED